MIMILALVVALLVGAALGAFVLSVVGVRKRDRAAGFDRTGRLAAPFEPSGDLATKASEWVTGYYARDGMNHS
ncbi:hypothetical protein [Nonomuraea sp. NPDC048916]|uniref:hypothetical protein n=1 Tax=Nonomuraea sp. NPDC048916 TaxID=3154232 RepID=UPI0033ECA2FF